MAATVTILQAAPQIIAAQPVAGGAVAAPAATVTQTGESFGQLVAEASAALKGAPAASRTATAEATPDMAATLTAMLSHEVTPADAADLLDQLDANPEMQVGMGSKGSDQQLKQQLHDIIATQIPKPMKDILAESTEETADTALPLTALPSATVQQASLGAAAQRVLSFLSKTIARKDALNPSQELPQEANAELNANAMNPALMILAAGPFPTTTDVAAEPEKTTDEQPAAAEQSASLVTTIIPFAQQAVIAAPAALDEAVKAKDLPATQAVDARVPGLKLTDTKGSLPQVTLPTSAKPSTTQTPAEFKGLVEQALESGGVLPKDIAPEASANLIGSIHHGANHTTVQGATAPAEAAPVTTTGIVNRAPVTDQVSVAIRQANSEGIEKITVQLDPLELGRVEVNMHVNKDGHAHVTFLIDKPETFDALSRDARHLERSLQEAGIKADTGGMQFNLRQQPQQTPDSNGQGNRQHDSQNDAPGAAAADKVVQLTPTQNYRINIHDGLDIRA